jgi:aminotransferase
VPDAYYAELAAAYRRRRDILLDILERRHFRCYTPYGAYYIMTDISGFGFPDDVAFVRHLIENIGVAAVPGSSFFNDAADGASLVRFCFCKKPETISAAADRLSRLSG